jgi:hypothetical protein
VRVDNTGGNKKMNGYSCNCHEDAHDMCFDGFATFADKTCSCCQNTLNYMNGDSEITQLAKIDSREVYKDDKLSDGDMAFLDMLEMQYLFQ